MQELIRDNITKKIAVIELGSNLDEGEISNLHVEITRHVIDSKNAFIFNFESIAEVSSGQAAVFLGLLATVRDLGMVQAVSNLQPQVEKIFKLVGILQAVPGFTTIEQAYQALGINES